MSLVQQRRTTSATTSTATSADLERQPTAGRTSSLALDKTETEGIDAPPAGADAEQRVRFAWRRFRGAGREIPSVSTSLKNIARHSLLNVLVVFMPLSWIAHFVTKRPEEEGEKPERLFGPYLQFAFSFLAIMPLEKTFDWLGEQMPPYVGAEMGELLEITLNNAVEASLAIFLLTKNRYRLLQTTIAGVVLLHLLLIPGVAFLTGGARIIEQQLHGQTTELNHSLLTLGVMTLVLPAAFFAALDRGSLNNLTQVVLALNPDNATETAAEDNVFEGGSASAHVPLLSDVSRSQFLSMSRALALLLLGIYVMSRFYVHNPPPEHGMHHEQAGSEEVKRKRRRKEEREPEIGPFVGAIAIVICVALMAVVAEWLVDSIEDVQSQSKIRQEWFGLFLLPIISFAADGLLAAIYFLGRLAKIRTAEPETAASGLAIDLSIQFLLFWLPVLVLIAWWTNKPFSLLFDLWEVVILVAACFLVNYVTADAKTNWIEGAIMISFYVMIAVCAWFYSGQTEVRMFVGRETVAEAVMNGPRFE